MPARTAEVVVASFNIHAGVDGWGRPWDVGAALRDLRADVVILQELWHPQHGVSSVEEAARDLGYSFLRHSLAQGRRARPHPQADHRWMRQLDWRGNSHAIYLDSERTLPRWVVRSSRFEEASAGSLCIAVLSRLPILSHEVVELGRLPRDRATRAAIVADVTAGECQLTVVGTHMSHLTYGSPVHFERLRRALLLPTDGRPAVLAGDMNLWGPPASLLLHGWRKVVSGRTWPSWRPHSQVDHIFVKGALSAASAEVLPHWGSDHRAVRARLVVS
jgi:endonuclease/exonuclease/phosphatase family metal-dependent hydrolase